MFYLKKALKPRVKKFVLRLKNLIKKGSINLAISACRKSPTPISQIMLAGLMKYGQSREEIKEAIEDSANQEIPVLEKRLSTLATIGKHNSFIGAFGNCFWDDKSV